MFASNGYKVIGGKVGPKLGIEIQGMKICHLFDLGEADLVLRIKWLKILGEVKVNWGQLTMKIMEGKKVRCIQGHPTLTKNFVVFLKAKCCKH